jgi:hypothetical protein
MTLTESSAPLSNCGSSSSNCLTIHLTWIMAVIHFANDKWRWRVQMDHRILLWTFIASPSLGLTSRCLRIYLIWTRNELEEGRRQLVQAPMGRPSTAGSGPDGGQGSPSTGEPAKNLYTKSERPTTSCKVTWAWSKMLNFKMGNYWYHRQSQKFMQHCRAPGSLPDG